jgi:nitrite reductase/ring-hydroxylating ferredoxin subunit
MAQQVFVCNEIEMKDGDVRIIRQDRNHCLHQGGPACEGIIRDRVVDLIGPDKTFLGQTYDRDEPHIVCPWHGWEYKLKTGECAPDPSLRLKRHEVVQRDGGIYVVI